ncbi:hypothetical protein K458DRAFT_5134 [Lentithecium fluviatile CBS 122367]|uniref:Uncharacterized protein n=1 Tax=Lentithecium fluviatile CBS 122367 TaxID=1168545 RepID=A0A6G1JND3_9PLEO|nr:hypothetical protein K458DRAFT_5134 [Lentithecium fluviatile CBS 122367]
MMKGIPDITTPKSDPHPSMDPKEDIVEQPIDPRSPQDDQESPKFRPERNFISAQTHGRFALDLLLTIPPLCFLV